MRVAGIIMEYDPMHGGHRRLLEEVRARLGAEAAVVGVMSGNFVQRGDFALLRKHARAEAAVRSGVDLVLELPLSWAASPAERFAGGGIQILEAAGLVTDLAFGSEAGEAAPLMEAAAALEAEEFQEALRLRLREGRPFPVSRQAALGDLIGPEKAKILRKPNNILAVEYGRALLRRGSAIRPMTVRRTGAPHGGAAAEGGFPSASALREALRAGERDRALAGMAPAARAAYLREEAEGRAPVFAAAAERAILARLRAMDEEGFAALDQGREGAYRRLYRASRSARSLEELLRLASSARYPTARMRRMLLWAYLGLTEFPEGVPYLRVLAANGTGRALLARMRGTASLPALTKPADVRRLGGDALRVFRQEARATDLYALAYPDLSAAGGGAEWRTGPVMV